MFSLSLRHSCTRFFTLFHLINALINEFQLNKIYFLRDPEHEKFTFIRRETMACNSCDIYLRLAATNVSPFTRLANFKIQRSFKMSKLRQLGFLNQKSTLFLLCDVQEKFRFMNYFQEVTKNTNKLVSLTFYCWKIAN